MPIYRGTESEWREFARVRVSAGDAALVEPLPAYTHGPRPGAVLQDRSALPVANQTLTSVWAYMKGAWVNITGMVQSWQVREGFDRHQRYGCARPTDGILILTDRPGRWSVMNPHAQIDPYPGVPIEIRLGATRTGILLFKGFSEGVRMRDTGENPPFIPIIPLAGLLKQKEQYGLGFTAKLSGESTPSEIIRLILDEVGIPAGQQYLSPNSVFLLFDEDVNSSTLLAQGNTRVKPVQALHEVAMVEGGIVYDDALGIHYETEWDRDWADTIPIPLSSPDTVAIEDQRELIINRVGVRQDIWERVSDSNIYFRDIDFPYQLTVPPLDKGQSYGYIFRDIEWGEIAEILDIGPGLGEESFIENWQDVVTDYGGNYDFSGREREIEVTFYGPNSAPQVVTVQQIRGQPLRRRDGVQIWSRNRESIQRYGPKGFAYPELILTPDSRKKANYLINRWANEWGGIDGDGNAFPPLGLTVTKKNINQRFPISSDVRLTWETPYKSHCKDWPFFVQGAEYTWQTQEQRLDVKLWLIDAWRQGPAEVKELRQAPGFTEFAYLPVGYGEFALLPVPLYEQFALLPAGAIDTRYNEFALLRLNAGSLTVAVYSEPTLQDSSLGIYIRIPPALQRYVYTLAGKRQILIEWRPLPGIHAFNALLDVRPYAEAPSGILPFLTAGDEFAEWNVSTSAPRVSVVVRGDFNDDRVHIFDTTFYAEFAYLEVPARLTFGHYYEGAIPVVYVIVPPDAQGDLIAGTPLHGTAQNRYSGDEWPAGFNAAFQTRATWQASNLPFVDLIAEGDVATRFGVFTPRGREQQVRIAQFPAQIYTFTL